MSRAAATFALSSGVWALALLAGCAAPGEPTARHPVVPAAIADLAARQAGNDVVLTFDLPTRSKDREGLAEMPSIEIYRATLPPGAIPSQKTPWRLAYSIPSERVDSYLTGNRIDFHDPLSPDDLARPAGSPLAYNVRTRVTKARASDDSNIFTVHIYPPPESPRGIRTDVTESAVVVSWTEPAAPLGASSLQYRVYRGQTESGQETAPPNLAQPKLKTPLELAGSSSAPEFHDMDFQFGNTYIYTVRSVAQFGSDSVESADSSPAVVTPRDIFPPAAPSGLEIAIVPATPQASAYVELSWAIGTEPDLAGYNVYRNDREDIPGERINGELLLSPTFRDISVMPSGRYFYRVSAVDRAGNESPKSSTVQGVIP
ncbi:MAG: hypothetical protein ABSA96_02800 [Candidatus Acidiferrales bacterium]|jgi:hypothetical protein